MSTARKKQAGEFLSKFTAMQSEQPELYRLFPAAARKAHAEAGISNALDTCTDVAPQMQTYLQNLVDLYDLTEATDMAAKSLESWIGTILKAAELGSEDEEVRAQNCAKELGDAMSSIMSSLTQFSSLKKAAQYVLNIARMPANVEVTILEESLYEIRSKVDTAVCRALHHNSFGEKILQKCETEVKRRTAVSSAVSNVEAASNLFVSTMSSDLYKSYVDVTDGDAFMQFPELLNALAACSEKAGEIASSIAVLESTDCKKAAIENFNKMAWALIQSTNKAMAGVLSEAARVFNSGDGEAGESAVSDVADMQRDHVQGYVKVLNYFGVGCQRNALTGLAVLLENFKTSSNVGPSLLSELRVADCQLGMEPCQN